MEYSIIIENISKRSIRLLRLYRYSCVVSDEACDISMHVLEECISNGGPIATQTKAYIRSIIIISLPID